MSLPLIVLTPVLLLGVVQNAGCNANPDDYIVVPAGSFLMGSPESEPCRNNDELQHQVTLSHSFVLKATEVTQGEWLSLMGNNPSAHIAGVCEGDETCPLESINWYEALAYCNALSSAEGLTPCYSMGCTGVVGDEDYPYACTSVSLNGGASSPYECEGYRLPTEAEWEYAARAGSETATYNGDIGADYCEDLSPVLEPIAWYFDNAEKRTGAVGRKSPNPLGFYDILGNVGEWTWDLYGSYSADASVDPSGDKPSESVMLDPNSTRVVRGGSVREGANQCRAAFRGARTPEYGSTAIGLRPARTLFE